MCNGRGGLEAGEAVFMGLRCSACRSLCVTGDVEQRMCTPDYSRRARSMRLVTIIAFSKHVCNTMYLQHLQGPVPKRVAWDQVTGAFAPLALCPAEMCAATNCRLAVGPLHSVGNHQAGEVDDLVGQLTGTGLPGTGVLVNNTVFDSLKVVGNGKGYPRCAGTMGVFGSGVVRKHSVSRLRARLEVHLQSQEG